MTKWLKHQGQSITGIMTIFGLIGLVASPVVAYFSTRQNDMEAVGAVKADVQVLQSQYVEINRRLGSIDDMQKTQGGQLVEILRAVK